MSTEDEPRKDAAMRITYKAVPGKGVRAVAFEGGAVIAMTEVYRSRYAAIRKLSQLLTDRIAKAGDEQAQPAQDVA